MFVSSDITEANNDWTGAVVLKTWGHEIFPHKELAKIKILGCATKGPNALGRDEPQNLYLHKHPATKQAL